MEVAGAIRQWEGDNGDKYPFNISVTNGGILELANGTNVWLTFLVMSNYFGSPKVLFCPADTNSPAYSWSNLTPQKHQLFR